MPAFRKKPLVVSAWKVRYIVESCVEGRFPFPKLLQHAMCEKLISFGRDIEGKAYGLIHYPEAQRIAADEEDWVILDEEGMLTTCKPDRFERIYEPA